MRTLPVGAIRAGLPPLAACLMFLLALAGIELTRLGGGAATVWLANAALIALLLRCQRHYWPGTLAAAAAGNLAAALLLGDPPGRSLVFVASNLAEILLVAALCAPRHELWGRVDTVAQLGRLGLLAIIGPVVATLGAGLLLAALGDLPAPFMLVHRLLAHSLGILLLAPLLLTLVDRAAPRGPAGRGEYLLLLASAGAGTAWVFSHPDSFAFLLTPLLVLAGFRLSLHRCAMLVALVGAVALALMLRGEGALGPGALAFGAPAFRVQAFMAIAVALTLPVAALRAERERTAAALRRSEEHYRLLADNSSDLVLRITAADAVEYVSSASERLLGLPAQRLLGDALAGRIHRPDLARFTSALERARRTGSAATSFRMRHANGEERWIEAQLRLAAPHRPFLFAEVADWPVVASLRDIHDRRLAEHQAAESTARLRKSNRLLMMAEELASLGHWVFDPARNELILSAEAATMLGLSQLTVDVRDVLGLLHAADRLHLLRTLAAARRAQAPAECTVRLAEGEGSRTFQLRMQLHGEDPASSLFGVVSEITAKLEADRQLVSALEEARAAASFRSQFLATMSHEIRTPMTGVIGMIELLEADPTPAEHELYLQTLRQSGDLLMAVLNDILDFSKVDAGRITIADEPFDLGATLLTTLRLYSRTAAARGLDLQLEAPPPGSLWLRGDAVRLRQVLSNLLSNAIKFSDCGTVVLRCAVQATAAGRYRLRLAVIDQGIGISPALRSRLFEPFVQGSANGHDGGTGLGLAISRRLIKAMGGNILVQSRPGEGATFTLALTLAAAEAQPATEHAAIAASARSLSILVAEDNPVNQLLVTVLCKRLGHHVTCAPDGEVAVAMARAEAFDLILMDMQMPRCDGLTAAHRIRAGSGPCATTPIVALTADASAGQHSLYEAAGLDGLLTKPIDGAAFAQLLEGIGRNSRIPAAPPAGTLAEPSSGPLDLAILDELRSVLGAARLDQLLALLLTELEERPAAIRAALADRDFATAAAQAHSLRGAAANLGALKVSEAAYDLQVGLSAAGSGNSRRFAASLRRLAAEVLVAQQAVALVRQHTIAELVHA